jgi:2-keto-3-deoxy-L-rhamnonate aldolase RhmA
MYKKLKTKLTNHEVLTGAWMMTVNPAFAEIASALEIDFLVVDMEHGAIGLADLPNILRGFRGPTVPLVRVPSAEPTFIARVLDRGARGIMVPRVDDLDTARTAARAAKYPPLGDRGLALPALRASDYGLNTNYRDQANEEFLTIIQLESRAAIESAIAIGQEPGVDMVFIGPTDLAANLKLEDPANRSELDRKINDTAKSCQAKNIPIGTITYGGRSVQDLASSGFQMLVVGSDVGMLREALSTVNRK